MRLFSVLLISLALLPLSIAIKCYTKHYQHKTQIETTCKFNGYCKTRYFHGIGGLEFDKRCSVEDDCPVKDGCVTYKKNITIRGKGVDFTQCCCKGDLCNKDDHLADNPTSDRYPPTVFPPATKCYTKEWEDKTQTEQTCGDGVDYCRTSAHYDVDGIRYLKSCTMLEECPVTVGGSPTTGCKTDKSHTDNSIGQEVHLTQCCCKGDLCNEDDHLKAVPNSDRSLPTAPFSKCYTKHYQHKSQIETMCKFNAYCKTRYYHDIGGLQFDKRCSVEEACPVKDGCVTYKNNITIRGEGVDVTKCCCKGDLCNEEEHLKATPTSDRYLPTL